MILAYAFQIEVCLHPLLIDELTKVFVSFSITHATLSIDAVQCLIRIDVCPDDPEVPQLIDCVVLLAREDECHGSIIVGDRGLCTY